MDKPTTAQQIPYFMSIRSAQRYECFMKYNKALDLFRELLEDSAFAGLDSVKPEKIQTFTSYLLAVYFDLKPALEQSESNAYLAEPLKPLDNEILSEKPRLSLQEGKKYFILLRQALDKLGFFE